MKYAFSLCVGLLCFLGSSCDPPESFPEGCVDPNSVDYNSISVTILSEIMGSYHLSHTNDCDYLGCSKAVNLSILESGAFYWEWDIGDSFSSSDGVTTSENGLLKLVKEDGSLFQFSQCTGLSSTTNGDTAEVIVGALANNTIKTYSDISVFEWDEGRICTIVESSIPVGVEPCQLRLDAVAGDYHLDDDTRAANLTIDAGGSFTWAIQDCRVTESETGVAYVRQPLGGHVQLLSKDADGIEPIFLSEAWSCSSEEECDEFEFTFPTRESIVETVSVSVGLGDDGMLYTSFSTTSLEENFSFNWLPGKVCPACEGDTLVSIGACD